MASLPEYLTDQTFETILQRLLDQLPSDWDKSEGSFVYDIMAALALVLAQDADWAQQVLERGFASTTFGDYLTLRAEEHGIIRKPATKATGIVTFTGTPGALVPAGTRVSTASTETEPAIVFVTDTDATISESGTVDVTVTAEQAGASGNVPAGSIMFVVEPISGVTGVTNNAATSGGADEESDEALLERYLTRVRNPSAGGNKADYVNWALEVQGVGGVSVVPVEDGPGTVSVYIVDTDKKPASQSIVDAVQNHIAPPHIITEEQTTLTTSGYGVSTDTQTDATDGTALKMIYNASGEGAAKRLDLGNVLPQPGIWQARVKLKVNNTSGTNTLVEIGVWNLSTGTWAKKSPSSTENAVVTFSASQLSTSFVEKIVEFYWNGQDRIELRITRKQTDTATTIWIDNVTYRSTFSKDDGSGRAPIGARVSVRPANAVLINVEATLSIMPGYNPDSVKSTVIENLKSYIKSIAFADNNDVLYSRVGQVILDTTGVQDYSNLLVNGGTSNVSIADNEVAVLNTVTLN